MYLENELSPRTLELFTELQSIVEPPEVAEQIPLGEIDLSVHAEDREYYDLHQAQLMTDVGFRVSCLMELLPTFQACMKEVAMERYLLEDVNSSRGWLPLQNPTLWTLLTKALPKITLKFHNRLFHIMRHDHEYKLPWICSFDNCPESTRVLTKEEWADHELRQHRSKTVWACHICQCEHVTLQEWKHHLDIVHSIRLQGDAAFICGRLSRKLIVEPMEHQVCGFCGDQPLHLGSPWEAFVEHVSSHMDTFADVRAKVFEQESKELARKGIPATAASSKKTPSPEQQSKSGTGAISERHVGKVKWFHDKEGFGFITSDVGDNLFVHFRAIQASGFKSLKEGQRVSFVIVQGQKGLQADELRAES